MTIERPMFPPRAARQDSLKQVQPSDVAATAVDALPAFLKPAWQHAVIRLANSNERLISLLSELMDRPITSPPTLAEYEELIENLIKWMDQAAGDPDVEDGADDEPSLGSHEITPAGAICYLPSWTRVAGFDVEEQSDDEGVTV